MTIRRDDGMRVENMSQLIWDVLRWKPGSDGMSAAQMQHHLAENGWSVKMSSLSSQLCKMVKSGVLTVLPNFGPRGGNGYVLNPET